MEVTICVGTYGSGKWADLARERAIPSAEVERVPVIHAHAESLAEARNAALWEVQTEWVIHLDADDELERGYVEAMSKGTADLRAPSVRYRRKHHPKDRLPGMPRVAGHSHDCTPECLGEGNWLVIGTCAKTNLLKDVGGWEEWPIYEDWALWLRCWKAGVSIEAVPEAIYCAYVNFESRNRAADIRFKNKVHYQIVEAILGGVAA